jgi:hypothetical protein|tara:strand:- start:553 stop:957 length:405 start_codon:yes stop_codon:yes gene_type:complete
MRKEQAIRIIIEYAADLPAKEALACHMAATDLQEYGIEEWIEWRAESIADIFIGILAESSANSIDKVQAHSIGEDFLDELAVEGYICFGSEDQQRIDYVETMRQMRESMLEGLDAMKTYFQVQDIIRTKYYGLH